MNSDQAQRTRHRVLHITFNMGFGGTEQVIRQLVLNLASTQFHNEILCVDGEVGHIGRRLQADHQIKIHCLCRRPGLDWRLAREIRSLIKDRGFEVIHCHQYTPWFYGWLASLGLGVEMVFTEHGRFHPDRYRRKAWAINKLMAATTSELVAISEATRGALVEYEFLPRKKIKVIYNGIEPLRPDREAALALRETLGISKNDWVFGTVSRLDPVKNQRMMFKAFAIFHSMHPQSWLLMVGDGPDRKMLQTYAQELGVDRRVIFTGFQSQPARYLEALDVFLLSSHTEGTSMTLLEAMSLGKPCVVTAVGGNPELIRDESNGLLVPSDDAMALSNAMQRLVDDKQLMARLGRNALTVFERDFSAHKMAAAYAALYSQTAALV